MTAAIPPPTARRLCECGAPAASKRNIGGVLTPRCVDCTRTAEAQALTDVAEAVANGATWLGSPAHDQAEARHVAEQTSEQMEMGL